MAFEKVHDTKSFHDLVPVHNIMFCSFGLFANEETEGIISSVFSLIVKVNF